MSDAGILYLVPTPIGNIDDITERAKQVLASVDLIAAEDTRHSQTLLRHLGIERKLVSIHEHNEQQKVAWVLEQLQQGHNIALISDAGTPLISDPGFIVVRECRAKGFNVTALPGACALTVALSASGLATDRFCFEGFLPAKSGQRRKTLQSLLNEPRTMIFYESPHRIVASLEDLAAEFGNERQMVMGRELTKQFETYLTGSIAEVIAQVNADSNQQRGEIVLLVAGCPNKSDDDAPSAEVIATLNVLREELPLKKAAALTAKIHGARKNTLYQWAIEQQ
ncbi:16S rRNA (cytidine(1402)-2'-O)-methyltransferase [Idiomarina tyrosinivorans]|uniref:Ribosomal RNA small subunit methyltransferase I n=1 Tax=Idiomarina tyrosinivorans TaxID=1445662 RepID=A0A432ZQH6_9GAMM|nr:16S rRNA (cytidine(1402)-2'-O)-methyltransferase [Idiomarina tyrosinivorans]RUO80091.1 16S rRNA (cytidine(1402)-2'-O)-methyltransferase [Idiomarina tyrosinivorans]